MVCRLSYAYVDLRPAYAGVVGREDLFEVDYVCRGDEELGSADFEEDIGR